MGGINGMPNANSVDQFRANYYYFNMFGKRNSRNIAKCHLSILIIIKLVYN